jgi:hypothetical protein
LLFFHSEKFPPSSLLQPGAVAHCLQPHIVVIAPHPRPLLPLLPLLLVHHANLVHHQIWLIPLVDDPCVSTSQNLKKRKEKKRKSLVLKPKDDDDLCSSACKCKKMMICTLKHATIRHKIYIL